MLAPVHTLGLEMQDRMAAEIGAGHPPEVDHRDTVIFLDWLYIGRSVRLPRPHL